MTRKAYKYHLIIKPRLVYHLASLFGKAMNASNIIPILVLLLIWECSTEVAYGICEPKRLRGQNCPLSSEDRHVEPVFQTGRFNNVSPPIAARLLYVSEKVAETSGDAERSHTLNLRALAIVEETYGTESRHVIPCLHQCSITATARGQWRESARIFERALKIKEKNLGPKDPDLLFELDCLGIDYVAEQQYADAQRVLTRSLIIREELPGEPTRSSHSWERGPKDAVEMARDYYTLATVHLFQRDVTHAIPIFDKALCLFENIFGKDSPALATWLGKCASELRKANHTPAAEKFEYRAKLIRANH
jgi:tetratricopeptide (TPR) repeat protein